MGEDVDACLDARPVRAEGNRFADRLPVQHHEACAELARPADEAADLTGGYVGELDPRNHADLEKRLRLPDELHERGDYRVEVRGIGVIRDADGPVARVLRPAH